jgi:hypothetical protein
MSIFSLRPLTLLLIFLGCGSLSAAEPLASNLAQQLEPFVSVLNGDQNSFAINAAIKIPIDGQQQAVQMHLERFDDQAFDLDLTHPDYAVSIKRRADVTAFALPKHQVVFFGQGAVDAIDHLAPQGITKRLISDATAVANFAPLATQGNAESIALVLNQFLGLRFNADQQHWETKDQTAIARFSKSATGFDQLNITADQAQVEIAFCATTEMSDAQQWPEYRINDLARSELEQTLARGVRRALEVLAPGEQLTSPAEQPQVVAHGELRWVQGHRVVLLSGTPAQIGKAHGALLKQESQRCIDSVLHSFGTVQTIINGRWFRQDLELAYAQLDKHIPQDHKTEINALAESLGQDRELMQALNVFPELFHCSGFAVFDSATADGKLYHGRVLDYMTAIGLQDAATTFIVAVDGKIPFANVGYASFTGSVSGMNQQAISLGEMGGRGEGKWDGAPMATLMRRSLEECSTLDEVINLWSESPRTCEYYYVFADGKTNRAVGVAATPESIQFIGPGEAHELLGEGIKDAVVLSAGSRLSTLRQRVMDKHGKIDIETAQWLMSRPVAMSSNLHNVLFVPADRLLFVANADHKSPAAERPYIRIDLQQLLDEMQKRDAKNVAATSQESR